MPSRLRLTGTLAALLTLCAIHPGAAAAGYDIPKLGNIIIDGHPSDWGDRGFRVEALATDDGTMRPADDFDAAFRLGWNEAGLLVLVTVRDSSGVESDSIDELWKNDSIEMFLASSGDGAAGYYQVIVAPGHDPKAPELRFKTVDRRLTRTPDLMVETARTQTDGGYVLEVLHPWTNLCLEPKPGVELYFSLWANDADAPDSVFQVIWHPRTSGEVNTEATHRLRLSETAASPVTAVVVGGYERMRRVRIRVCGPEALAGATAELRSDGEALARTTLRNEAGHAMGTLELRLPPPGRPLPSSAIFVNGVEAGVLELPDLAQVRARAVVDMAGDFNFHRCLLDGPAFPPCDFDTPSVAEDLLGRYTIETTFYDADYQPVTVADEMGRYGAVVQVTPETGRPLTLYRTLCRIPRDAARRLVFSPRNPSFTVQLPSLPGLDPAVVKAHAVAINEAVQSSFLSGTMRSPEAAILAAGLYEAKASAQPVTAQDDVYAQGRQWWVGLKRKLNGLDQAYPADLVCPLPRQGAPAPVLRAGTLVEAGMKPDTVEKLDALLTKWAADSDQGFAVFLARHGVIVLERAYGEREGRPMTLADKSSMASITKLLAGTGMMIAVDQGRVDLDDPVAKFLPAFRGVKAERPLTLRHLYTHTAGLWGHWGDELHDFDQLMGYYYPYLEVGRRYAYEGAGPSLGSKVLEMVSGEALPLFYKHHLLDPLGCGNTDVTTSSWDARSTARDIATIAQMLLNGGAYGDKQFLCESTVKQMLPAKVTKLVPADTTTEYGIGTAWFKNEGLAEGTWGHRAGSNAVLRIDPGDDLVLVVARNAAGPNFSTYHPQFLKLVAECLAPE